jgi:type I restriction enzyme M protein
LTNPPFGGEEEKGILGNFPEDMQTAETALLFLQLIMRKLKRPGQGSEAGGRAAVVVPNGTLFCDGIGARIKEQLLKNFNLHTIVRLPEGVFAPYTDIPANLLFFDRSGPTTGIWYYDIPTPEGRRKYTKTKPMEYAEFADCLKWWSDRKENAHAWRIDAEKVLKYDESGKLISVNLDIKNPNSLEALEHLPPEELIAQVIEKEKEIIDIMSDLRSLLNGEVAYAKSA